MASIPFGHLSAQTGGPRMSDAYLFSQALDLNAPGMQAVKSAANAGNWAAARAAWATHVRQRERAPTGGSEPSPFEPDDFGPKHRSNPRDYGGASSVWINYALHGGQSDDPNYDIDRAFKSNHLKGAAWGYGPNGGSGQTGNEEIPKAWVENSGRWMSHPDYKFPSYNTVADHPDGWKLLTTPTEADSGCWQYLAAGQRILDGWWNAYLAFIDSPEFTDDAIVNFTKSVLEHGMFLHTNVDEGFGNWRVCGLRGLYIVTCIVPECKWAEKWREFAFDELDHYADTHLMPDGSNAEICTHYGNLALAHQQGFLHQAEIYGHLDEIPAGDLQAYMDKLKTAYDFNLKIMTPDRKDIEIGGGRTGRPRDMSPTSARRVRCWLATTFWKGLWNCFLPINPINGQLV